MSSNGLDYGEMFAGLIWICLCLEIQSTIVTSLESAKLQLLLATTYLINQILENGFAIFSNARRQW